MFIGLINNLTDFIEDVGVGKDRVVEGDRRFSHHPRPHCDNLVGLRRAVSRLKSNSPRMENARYRVGGLHRTVGSDARSSGP